MAAGVAAGRSVKGTGGVLAETVDGHAGGGAAGGLCVTRGASRTRRAGEGASAGGIDAGVGEDESQVWSDVIHDVAGKLPVAAGTVLRAGRCGSRNRDREPDAGGDGGTDRIFRKSPGVAKPVDGRT